MFTTALKPTPEIFVFPPRWIPNAPTLDNFNRVLAQTSFEQYVLNNKIITTIQTIATFLLTSMAGYAFARLKWPGREPLFWLLVAKMMVPSIITLIPLFVMFKNVPLAGGNDLFGAGGTGLLDTYPGLILPGIVTPLAIFLFRQFFISYAVFCLIKKNSPQRPAEVESSPLLFDVSAVGPPPCGVGRPAAP